LRVRPLVFACLAVVALALAPAPAPASPATARHESRPSVAPATPRAAIRSLADAYESRSVERLGGLFSADYRFHFSSGDRAGAGYLNGFGRDSELRAANGLFNGVHNDRVDRPGVKRIRMSVGAMEEGADPEHPDSLSHYRVVVVHKLAFDIRVTDDETNQSLPSDHVFYLVRGDVAQRVEGQPGETGRWYIRRWMENIREVEQQLAGTDGRCEEAEKLAVDAGALAGVLAVRALDVPLCPTLDVVCDLPVAAPATLEVFDLQGRRLARQVLNPVAPGPMRVQAGSGVRFAPGAYWLRLTQATRPPGKRLVIVAR